MERAEILVLSCPLVWMHLHHNVKGVPGRLVDVPGFMLLCSLCVFFFFFSHSSSQAFVLSSAYWSVQPMLEFISLIIKKFDFFFNIGCLHKTSERSSTQNQSLWKLTPAFSLSFQVTTPSFGPVKTHELLHHMSGKGLAAKYHFPRQPCLYQPNMVAVQVILTNNSDHSLEKIHIGDRSPASLNIHCFNTIGES